MVQSCITNDNWEWGLSVGGGYLPTPCKDNAIQKTGGINSLIYR
jgi:hypothetical protein